MTSVSKYTWSDARTKYNLTQKSDICDNTRTDICDVQLSDSTLIDTGSFPAWVDGYVKRTPFMSEYGKIRT